MTNLRPQLDHYIRAFRERDDHPEERQDLGTFLTWLLRRCGYTIRLAPFHYDGPKRRVSKGRYQQGIDLVASRPSEGHDDCEDLFLFVLKPGDVGRSQWRDPKNIIGDLNELKYTKPQEHERWLPKGVDLGRVNIVVVHNGEFDDEALAGMRRNLQEDIEHFDFGFDWWSAPDLVDKTLAVLGEGPDHELFPPTVRPFYGALLDGLETGGEIAVDAVERLLAARFPCEKQDLLRTLTELSVFAAMMTNVPRARTQAVLPLLDMLLALIPRCAAAIVNAGANEHGIREALADLLASFVDMGSRFAQQLEPLAELEDGLVFPTVGEQIDWPLRTMWVLRYLALTARTANDLVVFERDGKQASRYEGIAARCLEMSLSLAERNLGAVGTPITDDQLIEYVLLWRTWLDAGRVQQTMRTVEELVNRLVLRRHLGLPGPALYQQAKTPITDADARALAEAWFGSRSEASTVFEDGGSTLLPLAIFVALRLGVTLAPGTFEAFGVLNVEGRRRRNMVHPQSWSPPEDASRRWYSEDLRYSGISHIYEFNSSLSEPEDFPGRFESRQERLEPSPMQMMGFECVDAMAWVHWRTRPPLAWLLDVLPKK